MLPKTLLLAWLATSGAAVPAASPVPPTAEAAPALTQEQAGDALVGRLAGICAAHPEVQRAFVFVQNAPDGSPTYTFAPIFDRKVSDEALAEADAAYRELFPGKGHLRLLLIPAKTWTRSLGGVAPLYVRPGK